MGFTRVGPIIGLFPKSCKISGSAVETGDFVSRKKVPLSWLPGMAISVILLAIFTSSGSSDIQSDKL